jgi:hypothetical protein
LTIARLADYAEAMSTTEQVADFAAFAKDLLSNPVGRDLSFEEVLDEWWRARNSNEDLAAIQASVEDFEHGERGRPAREELAQARAARSER